MAIKRTLSDARVDQAIDERDDKSGARRPGVIDYAKLGDVPTYKPKVDKTNKLNVIPYEIRNPQNPIVLAGKLSVGDLDMWLEVWAHRNIGADKAYLVCPNKMWGKRCPICERKEKLYDAGDEGTAKDFQPSKRLLMFVQPVIDGEPQRPHFFEVSHYNFGLPLLAKADRLRKDGKIKNFADPDRGNLVKFYPVNGTGRFKSTLEYEDFEFLEREEDIADEDLVVPSIDEHLLVYTYDELAAMLAETPSADEDEGRGRDRGSRRGRDDEDRGSRRGRDDEDRGSRRGRDDDDRGGRQDRGSRDEGGRGSRGESERGSRRGRDEDDRSGRRERGSRDEGERGSSTRDDDSHSSRRESEGRSTASTETSTRQRGDDPPPQPSSDAPERTRPAETPEIEADDRCPHKHGWGTQAVDRFPECATCSKWSDCLAGN